MSCDLRMASLLGYQCEFLDSVVSNDFYCKKCSLVARRLTLTGCCGESFCQACIASSQENGTGSCPECGATEFTTFDHVRSQKRINNLQVYCSMKERGCGWSGTLEQLDTHLDPHQDNCQYVDTECPLNCLKTIPKNDLDDHLAQHCVKRAYVCRHCSFKATYEEVVDAHLSQCKYVPLDCPNRCGVTFERDFLEDHMKMCRLEEVECELRGVGCGGRFLREDQEEHARQNSQKHLTLTASLAVETKEQLQQKLLELDQRHKEEEEKLKKKIEEQEKKLGEQGEKLEEHGKKLDQQNKKVEEQVKKLITLDKDHKAEVQRLNQDMMEVRAQNEMLKEQFKTAIQKLDQNVASLSSMGNLGHSFVMGDFSKERAKEGIWKSPAMYTHVCGYKFCIGVRANCCWTTFKSGHGRSVEVSVYVMPGEFDDWLPWPARAKFTVELVNRKRGENAKCTSRPQEWFQPEDLLYCTSLDRSLGGSFIEHFELQEFLHTDKLRFLVHVTDIKII